MNTFTPNAIARLLTLDLTTEHRSAVERAELNASRGVYTVDLPQAGIDSLTAGLKGNYAAHVAAGGAPYTQH